MPPGERLLPVMVQAAHKERTDRSLRQTRRADADAGSSSAFSVNSTQAPHRLANRAVDGLVVQTLQETIQRGEIGHAGEPEHLTQFAMFAEPHFGFAKSPIFVAHLAENGQQLGLRRLMFAQTAEMLPEILEDLLFGGHIYGRGGLIQDNQLGLLQHGPGYSQPLSFSSR